MMSQPLPCSPAKPSPSASHNVERLATLDAYAGLADRSGSADSSTKQSYRSSQDRGLGDLSLGNIEIRGWGQATQTIPISSPLSLLRFAPSGTALLEAERVPSGGEQVYPITSTQPRTPIVAVPGAIVRLAWRPDSRAVVIHSLQGELLPR